MTATVVEIRQSIQRMVCTACGAEANASCNCGVAYQPKSVRAGEAIKANPEKSNRAIAGDTGIGLETVRKARNELTTSGQLKDGPRTGLDGKTRNIPTKPDRDDDEEGFDDALLRKEVVRLTRIAGPVMEITEAISDLLEAGQKMRLEAFNYCADAVDECLESLQRLRKQLRRI
jgi:hypothetical protein